MKPHIPLPAVFPLVAVCLPALAQVKPDDSPAGPGEWGFRPVETRVCAVDPPAFVWRPQKGANSYELQVARAKKTGQPIYEASGLSLCCHTPPRPLGPGRYSWRFRFTDDSGRISAWSRNRSFILEETSVEYPLPERHEVLARIPAGHPRLFLRPEDLPRFRELCGGRLRNRWESILRECERILESPPDVTEPPRYPPEAKRGENDKLWREIWWGNRKRVIAVTNSAATLAFAYLLGGDERFARESRRLILAACTWDPKGATGYRYNDEAGMPFAYYTARTATWLHDYLGEEDRRRIREVMKVRGEEIYEHLLGRRHIWRPYGSHANRAWHWLGEVGTAFHGEIEGAGDWAWFALNVFFSSYPVWNDERGGWHEGISYWNSYLTRVTWWLATLRSSYGIDGYRKPFFSKAGDFALYVNPPGETLGGFGDLTLGFKASRASPTMSLFARATGNPYWQWYVEESGGSDLPGGYMGVIYGSLPPVEARVPADLPSSVLFPGTGVAALHNDLVNRGKDVLFMLKASPMGTQSHGYDSQNAFLLSVAGDPVFVYSGWRDLYGSPHHRDWMWETKSQNCILVGGRGQMKHSSKPLGEITHFATTQRFDHVVGEAAPAYAGALEGFTRSVVFIKPEAIVIRDVLEATEPSTFQWLLHARRKMDINGQTIKARGLEEGACVAQILKPEDLKVTQTDRFDPPPQEWVRLVQWHLEAATPGKQRSIEFLTVLRPFHGEEGPPPLGAKTLETGEAAGCRLELHDGAAVVLWRKSGSEPVTLGGLTLEGEVAAGVFGADGEPGPTFQR